LTTNPTLDNADIWHALKHHLSLSATYNGKSGLDWHELLPTDSTTARSTSVYYAGVIKGVRVIDEAGNPFVGFVSMQADDGTTYVPPVVLLLTIAANVSLVGAEVRIYDLDASGTDLGTELAGGTESAAGATVAFTSITAANTVWIQIMLAGYEEFGQSYVMPAANSTLTAILTPDRNA
jgi:hypothetical protein